MFITLQKNKPHVMPIYTAVKRNSRSILITILEENNHGLYMGPVNKKLRQVSFKTLVQITEHQKEIFGFILDEWKKVEKWRVTKIYSARNILVLSCIN